MQARCQPLAKQSNNGLGILTQAIFICPHRWKRQEGRQQFGNQIMGALAAGVRTDQNVI